MKMFFTARDPSNEELCRFSDIFVTQRENESVTEKIISDGTEMSKRWH